MIKLYKKKIKKKERGRGRGKERVWEKKYFLLMGFEKQPYYLNRHMIGLYCFEK